jgi:hypothetical protein
MGFWYLRHLAWAGAPKTIYFLGRRLLGGGGGLDQYVGTTNVPPPPRPLPRKGYLDFLAYSESYKQYSATGEQVTNYEP